MAYSASGGFPAEYASKLGHMRLIKDPLVQKVMKLRKYRSEDR